MRFPLLPADLSFVDRAPIVNRQTITLAAPPTAVWPAFAEASTWTEWWHDMTEARYTSEPPHTDGSTRTVSVGKLVVDETLLAFEPELRYAFRVDSANVPFLQTMVEDIRLAATTNGAGTTVTYVQGVELKRWAGILRRPFERQLRTSLQQGLAGLPTWVQRHT